MPPSSLQAASQIGVDEWCVTYRLRTLDGQALPHDQCPMAVALKENRAIRGVEAMAERPDGTLVPFMPFPTPLRDETGQMVGAVNMLVDVSQRKAAEANQRLLLNELNHRVKNNLQMLHGLLKGAGRETESEEAGKILDDAAQRVAAIAAAQRLLYLRSEASSFKSATFLEMVCDNAKQSFPETITVRVDSEDFELPDDVATPLALIVNELVTNAAKYGVPGKAGEIRGRLNSSEAGVDLFVEDDGPGYPQPPKREKRASGLGLVRGLVAQLGGNLELLPGTGARSHISFPLTQ